MKLREFVSKFVCCNSLIRLWKPIGAGRHEMIYIKDERKPGNIDDVCMEWQLLNNKVWQSAYNDYNVIGVKDIVVDGHYSEAINIVIDINSDKEVIVNEPLPENPSGMYQLKMEVTL